MTEPHPAANAKSSDDANPQTPTNQAPPPVMDQTQTHADADVIKQAEIAQQ